MAVQPAPEHAAARQSEGRPLLGGFLVRKGQLTVDGLEHALGEQERSGLPLGQVLIGLGLALWLGERIAQLMQGRGHRLSEYQGNDGWFVPLPATFVVGTNGRVLARHVDAEFRQRMEIDDILEALLGANAAGQLAPTS